MTAALVSWSGGLDSTTALIKVLRDTDWSVLTQYVNVDNNRHKVRCEREAIHRLRKVLKRTYRDFEHTEDETEVNRSHNGWGLMQPPMWAIHACYAASALYADHDDVRIVLGWTRGDDAVHHHDNIVKMIEGIWNVMCDRHPVPLIEAPLLLSTKYNSVQLIKAEERRRGITVLDHIWTCEGPERLHGPVTSGYVACGTCPPCVRGIKAGLINSDDLARVKRISLSEYDEKVLTSQEG